MKNICFGLIFFWSLSGSAQDWQPDFETAMAKASEENKPLILVFSGSDWCAPCIKLDRAIWQSKAFRSYADENYVLYKADFPRKKKNQLPETILNHNTSLAQRFNSKGYFPLVLVLGDGGQVLGTTGYQKIGPEKYIQLLDSFYQ